MEEERPSCCKEEYGKARSVSCQCISFKLGSPALFFATGTKPWKRIYT